jgi:PAS domain S-box-containing protein
MTELVADDGCPAKNITPGMGPTFQDLVSNLNLIALILNASAKLTFCNDYFLALTGWTRPEVLGCDWFQRFVPPGIDDLRGVFSELLQNQPNAWHHENAILCKSSRKVLIRWHNSVIRDSSGQIVGIASIGEDVTEHRLLEREQRSGASTPRCRASRWPRTKPVCREPAGSQSRGNSAESHAPYRRGPNSSYIGDRLVHGNLSSNHSRPLSSGRDSRRFHASLTRSHEHAVERRNRTRAVDC